MSGAGRNASWKGPIPKIEKDGGLFFVNFNAPAPAVRDSYFLFALTGCALFLFLFFARPHWECAIEGLSFSHIFYVFVCHNWARAIRKFPLLPVSSFFVCSHLGFAIREFQAPLNSRAKIRDLRRILREDRPWGRTETESRIREILHVQAGPGGS